MLHKSPLLIILVCTDCTHSNQKKVEINKGLKWRIYKWQKDPFFVYDEIFALETLCLIWDIVSSVDNQIYRTFFLDNLY